MKQLHIQFGESQVTVETDVPEARDFVGRTFAHMLSSEAPKPVATIQFLKGPRGYSLSAPGSDRVEDEWLELMTGLLKDEVRHQFINSRSDLLWLHSGAVENNGYARLICGPTGSGKSTLTTMLCERGWRLLSDDAVPIRMDADTALPFAHSASRRLRPDAFLGEVEFNGLKREDVEFGRDSIRDSAAPIKDIVFPTFSPDEESITAMTSADAAIQLLRSSINFAAHGAAAVSRAAKLAAAAPSYKLLYRNAENAIEMIEALR